jgi:beta-apo-4'-carotenal oxygenase
MEKMLAVRYPPYSDAKLKQFRKMSEKKPNFDREGKEIKGLSYWLSFLGVLGSEGLQGALIRWAVVAILAIGAKRYIDTGVLPSFADLKFWKN